MCRHPVDWFAFRALRQMPLGYCSVLYWSHCRLTMNLTLMWNSWAGVCCNSQTLTSIHITRPASSQVFAPGQRICFEKRSLYYFINEWSPSAFCLCFSIRLFFAVLLLSFSLWGCFNSTCSCQICFLLPVCCEQVALSTWPWALCGNGSDGGVDRGEYRCL